MGFGVTELEGCGLCLHVDVQKTEKQTGLLATVRERERKDLGLDRYKPWSRSRRKRWVGSHPGGPQQRCGVPGVCAPGKDSPGEVGRIQACCQGPLQEKPVRGIDSKLLS